MPKYKYHSTIKCNKRENQLLWKRVCVLCVVCWRKTKEKLLAKKAATLSIRETALMFFPPCLVWPIRKITRWIKAVVFLLTKGKDFELGEWKCISDFARVRLDFWPCFRYYIACWTVCTRFPIELSVGTWIFFLFLLTPLVDT